MFMLKKKELSDELGRLGSVNDGIGVGVGVGGGIWNEVWGMGMNG